MRVNWEAVARTSTHPVQVAIIEWLAEVDEGSPVELAKRLDKPLGVVSHHFRKLAARGLIELARTEPRRGALRHFYRLCGQAKG